MLHVQLVVAGRATTLLDKGYKYLYGLPGGAMHANKYAKGHLQPGGMIKLYISIKLSPVYMFLFYHTYAVRTQNKNVNLILI